MTLYRDFSALTIAVVSSADLDRDALVLAGEFGLPAVYDAHYVVLARTMNVDLWTADQRLLRSLGGRLPFVRSISDYDG